MIFKNVRRKRFPANDWCDGTPADARCGRYFGQPSDNKRRTGENKSRKSNADDCQFERHDGFTPLSFFFFTLYG